MLILTRRAGESFMIGDDVKVVIIEKRGNQIRVGIEAPTDIGVHRQEIYNRIQQDKKRKRTETAQLPPQQYR